MAKNKAPQQADLKTDLFTVTMAVNGSTHTATGETVQEAISNLGIDYTRVKTKGEIVVSYKDNTHTRVIQLPKLRRYLASKILMIGFIRDLEKLVK